MTPGLLLGALEGSRSRAPSNPLLALSNVVVNLDGDDLAIGNNDHWDDSSGNNNHATMWQPAGNKPQGGANTPTGKKALYAIDSSSFLQTKFGLGDIAMSGYPAGGYVPSAALKFVPAGTPGYMASPGWLTPVGVNAGAPGRIVSHHRTPFVMTSLIMCGGAEGERYPKNFTIEGSHDGTTWDVLKTVTGQVWAPTFEIKEYTWSNTTAYEYYSVKITESVQTGERASLQNYRPNSIAGVVVNSGELWVVAKAEAGGGMPVQATQPSNDTYFPYSIDGLGAYVDFGNVADRPNVVISPSVVTAWRVIRFWATQTHRGFDVDGIQQQNQALKAQDWRDGLLICGQQGRHFNGGVAHVFARNAHSGAIGSTDELLIRNYLRTKYIAA